MSQAESALIVGCGSIGSRHAQNLSSLGVDVCLFDIDHERAKSLAKEVDGEPVDNLEAGLQSDPGTVFITTPSNHHTAPAKKAANAGCDLFIEKPLSNTTNGVAELVELIEEHDLTTMIGCNMRFHPAIQTAKECLEDDRIGTVVSARIEGGSYLPDWHPEEDYREMYSAKKGVGGATLDYIHEINYAQWLFGEITAVSAMLGDASSLDIETEDTAAVVSRTATNQIIEFHLDYVQRKYSRSYHIVGEEGTLRWEWEQPTVQRYDPHDETWIAESAWDNWEMNQMYVDEIEHFLSCVENNRETVSPVRQGYRDLKVALAAKESASSERHVTI
jgi:predicted dehydrogenase